MCVPVTRSTRHPSTWAAASFSQSASNPVPLVWRPPIHWPPCTSIRSRCSGNPKSNLQRLFLSTLTWRSGLRETARNCCNSANSRDSRRARARCLDRISAVIPGMVQLMFSICAVSMPGASAFLARICAIATSRRSPISLTAASMRAVSALASASMVALLNWAP